MGLFDFMKRGQSEINKAVEKLKGEPLAVLLDVREPGEFQGGHIPGSINIPVGNLSANNGLLPDKSAPIYVYCQSGARSSRAEKILKTAGFTNVTNIGGIMSYRGPLE